MEFYSPQLRNRCLRTMLFCEKQVNLVKTERQRQRKRRVKQKTGNLYKNLVGITILIILLGDILEIILKDK